MSQPFKLFRLQQKDSQIDQYIARLRQIELEIKDDRTLKNAIKNSEISDKEHQKSRNILTKADDNLQKQRLKIETTESMLYSGKVKNPKELQDLENEAISLKRYLSVLEDRYLEALLEEEEFAVQNKSAQIELKNEENKHSNKLAELGKEKHKLESDVARISEERDVIAGSIDADDLNLYERLRKSRSGVAVARVTDKACSACGTTLSATLLHAARNPNQINRCETCSRILYLG
ncbi:MAG: zinc ribbon domain-containing protein [Anaerolineales bacterium]